MAFLAGFIVGLLFFIGYGAWRATRNKEWDDSNITNWLRLLSHTILHPEDFAKMQYPDGTYPFWYISKDELSEVVKTRPKK